MVLEPQQPEDAEIVSSSDPDEADEVSSMNPESSQPPEAKGSTSFNPELLKLPEASPTRLNTRGELVEEMFQQWLSLPENSKMMKSLIENAMAAGKPMNTIGNTVNADVAFGSSSSYSTLPASLLGLARGSPQV